MHRGVVKWYNRRLQTVNCGFDSCRPCQIEQLGINAALPTSGCVRDCTKAKGFLSVVDIVLPSKVGF